MGESVARVEAVEDLRGPAGRLEAVLNTPAGVDAVDAVGAVGTVGLAAVVAHPHPLFGGTMHNKVVYHAAKTLEAAGLPVLRFNFRGVGRSEGVHDRARGEQDDVRAALDWMGARFGGRLLLAGFSFGSYTGLRACVGDERIAGMVGLGLPVQAGGRGYEYGFLSELGGAPKLFVSGDQDEFSPRGVLEGALAAAPEPKRVVWVEGADHFFAGTKESPGSKLGAMQAAVGEWLREEMGVETGMG